MGFFDSLTGKNIGKATEKAIGQNRDLLQSYGNKATQFINTGEQNSIGALDEAAGAYSPWASAGGDALGMYTDALGLNGAEGNARATGAFQTGPGYQFAVDEGMRAAERAASASGMLGSGNLFDELARRGQGYANQEYGSWLDRLNGVSGQGLTAASGQAGAYAQKAGIYDDNASDRVAIAGGVTQGEIGFNNDLAKIKEQREQAKGSFFGSLLKTGLSLGTKAFTGGLF